MVKYRISLTAEARAALEQLVSVGQAAARQLTQARILLLADTAGEGQTAQDIADALGTSVPTSARGRQRLVTQGIEAAVNHRPQPPRPDQVKIKGTVEQALVRLSGSDPPQGRGRWTLCRLADELVARGLLPSVSRETVRPALKKMPSSPGSSKSGASRRPPTRSSSGGWRM